MSAPEGVLIEPGSDEAKAVIRACSLLVRDEDNYWFSNALRSLAARVSELEPVT